MSSPKAEVKASPTKSMGNEAKTDGVGAGAAVDGEDKVEIPKDISSFMDMDTFQQIRDMDEEDDEEDEPNAFSKGIVFGFFEQAEDTLEQMDKALQKKDLSSLSSLGHFLKGSSAALGVIKVQNACELIQHYGNKRDEKAGSDLTKDEALKRIGDLLKECRKEYRVAKAYLESLYE